MTTENGSIARLLPCLLDGFLEYTAKLPTPLIFRKWAAVSLVAGAVERRVWCRVFGSDLYPNLFILLIGAPGVGKSMSINPVHQLWANTGKFNVSPTSVTRAGFVDQLHSKARQVMIDNVPLMMHPLNCAAPEFGTLVPSHDLEFLNTLNDVYDCRQVFDYRLRSSNGTVTISYPHLNLIAGTQPKYLASLLPEEAYGMGFTSRIIMVYSADAHRASLFSSLGKNKKLETSLISDMRTLSNLTGEMQFDPAASALLEEWHKTGCEPVPTHVRLQSYATRRIIHLIKLTMVFSLFRSSSKIITLEDVKEAMELLLDAEAVMPEIFKEMSTQTDSELIDETYNWMWQYYQSKKKPIREHLIINKLRTIAPTWKIDYIIKTMMGAEMVDWSGAPGARQFVPKAKHEFAED